MNTAGTPRSRRLSSVSEVTADNPLSWLSEANGAQMITPSTCLAIERTNASSADASSSLSAKKTAYPAALARACTPFSTPV